MQISPIKNPKFKKPSRKPTYQDQSEDFKKKISGYLSKKIWFRVCSVTAEMFEHRNSGENRRKRSEIFFANLRRAYKDLIQVKKKSKLSHACVPLRFCIDFLKHREGDMVFDQVFILSPLQCDVNLLQKYVRGCVSLKKNVRGCMGMKIQKSQGNAVEVTVNSKEENS